jgi:hypothetical protein
MSDIKLFRVDNGKAQELAGSALAIEKTLQSLIERSLDAMLGIRFVASEHSTGKRTAVGSTRSGSTRTAHP